MLARTHPSRHGVKVYRHKNLDKPLNAGHPTRDFCRQLKVLQLADKGVDLLGHLGPSASIPSRNMDAQPSHFYDTGV